MEWYDDLCEYYNVSPEVAIELGVRKSGRRPNLPGSKTCKPVSGKTFEELWGEKERKTLQQKMDFYKDIGAWQVFRQCNWRHNFNYRSLFDSHIKSNSSILEYGCGVAPFTNYIIENSNRFGEINGMKFCLVDVEGEHIEFAEWRLKKKSPNSNFVFHKINSQYPIPLFEINFDICCIMDVMEHLPNPYDVIRNIYEHCNKECIMVMTWVDKSDGKTSGPDLEEAEKQRAITMGFINSHFNMIKNGSIKAYQKI
jgi:2-polyprenyl-3-methyl-5-hydroxy-6-metoxy-1,4-benzoquinol methylase